MTAKSPSAESPRAAGPGVERPALSAPPRGRDRWVQWFNTRCLNWAARRAGRRAMIGQLREWVPDISNQESSERASFNAYWELKRRSLQAFQCELMREAVALIPGGTVTVVDIGDSAGTHLTYLNRLVGAGKRLRALGVNLDPRAVEKIRSRGLEALLCRAENVALDRPVDLFVSFEMLEHLHNPALFLRRLAKRPDESRLLLTVPYVEQSRVALHHTRRESSALLHAEDEHVFEFSPSDWTALFRHAGWRPRWGRIYRQYPDWPGAAFFFGRWWRRVDYEGFWGVLLEKDTALSDRYLDWEE